jgi:ectoine hydroxylase-related dioxygenase (phytanoyl-CoA dioxygenase family)
VEIHPQALRGFVDLVSHPWVTEVCGAVLGPDYEIVEIGFDVPFGGAMHQPWHRDFPSPPETYDGRRLTSLAFNLTAVDTVPEMGPFEIAPGTQWEPGTTWEHGMFPPESEWARYESLAQPKLPQRGDISARSALTVHRGTANGSGMARPVLVLGVDAPGAGHAALHDLQVTSDYHAALPEVVRRHLHCRVVESLEPITQKHQIEGLVMGRPAPATYPGPRG